MYFFGFQVFDMKEFRSHVILEIHKQGLRKLDLLKLYPRCCIVSVAFVKAAPGDDMETPCWLNIIHLGALRLLQDDKGMLIFYKNGGMI